MPPRQRKDVSEDLKKAALAHIKAEMPYRNISTLTGLSVGAISAIKKYGNLRNFGGWVYSNVFLKVMLGIFHVFRIYKLLMMFFSFRNKLKLGRYHPTERTVVES